MSDSPTYVLTLVAPQTSDGSVLLAAAEAIEGAKVRRLGPNAIDVEAPLPKEALEAHARTLADAAPLDWAVLPVEGREKSLLLCDMDSTIIQQECIDALADLAGCGPEIAAVTEAAMAGKLGFEEALRARVAKLKGEPLALVEEVLSRTITLSPGAQQLVQTMRQRGATTALVSGGFTHFTGPVAKRVGFELNFGNELHVAADGTLTGTVAEPILGANAKAETLARLCAEKGLNTAAAIVIGDGANDLAMVKAAGLGIAYRAKAVLRDAADAEIAHTDLSTALYFQGIPHRDFTS